MKRARYLPLGLVFAAALLLPLAWLLSPRQDFSALERRFLSPPPVFSLQGGVFSQGMEDYLNDHFPLRAAFLRADAERRLLSGQNLLDPVWVLADGSLAEAPVDLADSRLEGNLQRLRDFALASGRPAFLLVPPAKGAAGGQKGYTAYPDRDALKDIAQKAEPALRLIPLYDDFLAAGGGLYYSTDPHWNAKGTLLAYRAVAQALGFEPLPGNAFQLKENPGFYGTEYARAAFWERPADALQMLDAGVPLSLRFGPEGEARDSLFFDSHLNTPDQYPAFLDGNHGLTLIDNLANPEGPGLLVLKDSFGNSLVPLLLPHFGRITVIDLRAYRGAVSDLPEYNAADAILMVYSLPTLAKDTNFPWLI